MKQNYKVIPLDISSNYSPIYTTDVGKTSINRSTSIHISYENRSNIYVQNDYNPYKKYTNNLIFSKNREMYPSINGQATQNDYYDRQNYNNDRYSESYENREYLLSPINRSNNRNIFNGNQNKYQNNNNNYDNNNDIDKNKGNYTYYESKYSRKKSIEKDSNFNNNNFNENVYYNENYNISNISVKNNKYDTNYNIKTNEDNSNIKKNKNNMIYSKMQNAKNKISSNSNINNDTIDKIKNNCNYPNSNNTHLDISKDSYHSPLKTVTVEKGTYNVHDKNNYSRNEKRESSKSSDKIKVNTDILKIKNEIKNQNKKVEMVKMNKSNLIGLKKTTNLKKIPLSSIDNKKSLNDQKALNSIKEKKQKIENNYSYSEIKPKENKTIFQSDHLEIKDKKGLTIIKGVKLTNNKLFRKSISSIIGQTHKSSPDRNKNKNNINKIVPSSLDNDDNKIINISQSSISNHKDNEETGKKHNIVLSNLKKGRRRSEIKDDQSVRRLHSHQKLNIFLEFNNEKVKPKSSKILPTFKNNLVEYNILEHSQRYINDSILNQKKNNRNNNSIFNSKTYNKYNNYTEVKKSSKNKNSIHTIGLNRIKTTNLDNIHLLTLNPNKSNLTRKLKTPMKIQNQTKEKLKFVENEEDDNWDDIEYLGLRKRTYDIGQRQRKNKNVKLKSKTSFIKSCESLSIPGRNDEGNKKINQDSYIIERNINGIVNFNIYAVLDGHGENGHYASQFVSRYMISHIKNHPLINKCENAKEIYGILKNNGYEIIANLYSDADVQITKETFDCKNSGTTCVMVIQLEDKIICSNAGDSRAILIYDKNNNSSNLINSKIYPLSFDCKPDLPNEKKRILGCGGFVGKSFDQYDDQEEGPFRVFEKGEDYPGIAISRSIGDMDAKKIGVIPNPQIIEYKIDNDTKYMLICSDGIWEFISNEEAMKIGNKFYSRNDAMGLCQKLYKTSLDLWLQEDVCVDDITVIAVFF